MALRDMSEEEILEDIHSMEVAIKMYSRELKRRILALSDDEEGAHD